MIKLQGIIKDILTENEDMLKTGNGIWYSFKPDVGLTPFKYIEKTSGRENVVYLLSKRDIDGLMQWWNRQGSHKYELVKEIGHHTLQEEDRTNMVPIEEWKMQHVEHLNDVGFMDDGMYHVSLRNPPLQVSYKKGQGFVLEDKKKKKSHVFPRFSSLCQHLEDYEQEWENQPYL